MGIGGQKYPNYPISYSVAHAMALAALESSIDTFDIFNGMSQGTAIRIDAAKLETLDNTEHTKGAESVLEVSAGGCSTCMRNSDMY